MRIRYPFAAAFVFLLVTLGYLGLASFQISAINDKVLHFLAFFLLTITFYWALDIPRRLLLKITLVSITLLFSLASEALQHYLPNDRTFDAYDVVANIIGSILALALCAWYHKRMLERKRRRKLDGYGLVGVGDGEDDVELGASGQETGITDVRDSEDDGGEAWDEIGGSEGTESSKVAVKADDT